MLTDSQIKSAKPKDKPYKLADANRLYLYVSTKGTRKFKLDYRLEGISKTLVIGEYPLVSLADARAKANDARKQIAKGISPDIKSASVDSFKSVALEFCGFKGWNDMHKQRRRLELYLFPFIGLANIRALEPTDILSAIRRIEGNGTGETAHRTLALIGQIFRYAVASGYVKSDITRDLRGALKPVKGGNFTAIIDPSELKSAYKAIGLMPSIIVRNALKMVILTAARPGELRAMRWDGINKGLCQWAYIAPKTSVEMIVPLSRQAMAIVSEMALYTSFGDYVFSSLRGGDKDRPLSDTAMLMALQRAGIQSTVHGFRASFRTIAAEVLNIDAHLLEHQLGHTVRDPLGRAYNRTTYLEQRQAVMQRWADWLES
jgi:integrase